jgi:hypothetical protein
MTAFFGAAIPARSADYVIPQTYDALCGARLRRLKDTRIQRALAKLACGVAAVGLCLADALPANAQSRLYGVFSFTSNGTITCSSNVTFLVVEVVGGGAGGGGAPATTQNTHGSSGAGGSGGGYYKSTTNNLAGCGATVTIGSGGAGGTGSGTPGTGGTTSVVFPGGLNINCSGGAGNPSPAESTSTVVGANVGGSCSATGVASTLLNVPGAVGGWGATREDTASGTMAYCIAGQGGSTPLGSPGEQVVYPISGFQSGGQNAAGYGAGGGAAFVCGLPSGVTNQTGGAGAPGHVTVWEYGL